MPLLSLQIATKCFGDSTFLTVQIFPLKTRPIQLRSGNVFLTFYISHCACVPLPLCQPFFIGWVLIVRAGNKGKSQQKSMAVNYDTCELAFSTAPLSLVSTQICMVSPDILRSTQSLGLSRKGRLTVLTEKAARSTLYDLVLPLFFRGFSQQPRCP